MGEPPGCQCLPVTSCNAQAQPNPPTSPCERRCFVVVVYFVAAVAAVQPVRCCPLLCFIFFLLMAFLGSASEYLIMVFSDSFALLFCLFLCEDNMPTRSWLQKPSIFLLLDDCFKKKICFVDKP
ncbi:hypothetical protein ABZP36_026773 [Zizania latifolia]